MAAALDRCRDVIKSADPASCNAVDKPSQFALRQYMQYRAEGERLLGDRAWFLLESYGKLMDGPHSGSYVSALPGKEKLDLARRLVAGETIYVHLMHRHRSGNYEASSLRLVDGKLVMVFRDRVRIA